jgi:hypothetical protein
MQIKGLSPISNVPQDTSVVANPVAPNEEKIAVSPLLDASFYAATDNILNQADSLAFAEANKDSVLGSIQAADISTNNFTGDLSLGAVPKPTDSMPSYSVSDVLSNAGKIGFELGSVDHPAASGISSAEAAAATASPAADEKRCPKCGADLHGQFAFCLGCLSPL